MHILIIEQDKTTNKNLSSLLKKEGMISEFVSSGQEGLELLNLYNYDLIIIDPTLPDYSGEELLKQIRSNKIKVPVLILSKVSMTAQKVMYFNLGADDYLTKPFDNSELVARVKALIRRSKGLPDSVIQIGKLSIDTNSKKVYIDQEHILLTAKEYALLELLAFNKGTTITKENCINQLYGLSDDAPNTKIIDVFLFKIRQKIKKYTNEEYIENRWGQGYLLKGSKN